MDWGSLTGLALALIGILLGQVIEGGQLGSLVQPAAFVIVFVGTTGAVLLQSGMPVFLRGVKRGQQVFFPPLDNSPSLIRDIVTWSAAARREGLLNLERFLTTEHDPFVAKGLRLIVD